MTNFVIFTFIKYIVFTYFFFFLHYFTFINSYKFEIIILKYIYIDLYSFGYCLIFILTRLFLISFSPLFIFFKNYNSTIIIIFSLLSELIILFKLIIIRKHLYFYILKLEFILSFLIFNK